VSRGWSPDAAALEVNVRAEQEIKVILRHLEYQNRMLIAMVQKLDIGIDYGFTPVSRNKICRQLLDDLCSHFGRLEAAATRYGGSGLRGTLGVALIVPLVIWRSEAYCSSTPDAASRPPSARAAILSATKSTAVIAELWSSLIERRSHRPLPRLQGRCWPEWQFHDTTACRTMMGLHRAYCVTNSTKR
jgi:hypothetical protein